MNESFLHYLWQHQYFNKKDLYTADKELIQVLKPGTYNRNAGPDFSESKIKIGKIEWAGSVEIHIKSSDYIQHKHNQDQAYNNVVLHVVWDDDKALNRPDGTIMPTLVLKDRVDDGLLKEYKKLVNSSFQIPCANSFGKVNDLTKVSMIEKAVHQRLNSKAAVVQEIYRQTKGDWEETFYQVLSKNFGFKVNSEPFHSLSKALPLKVIRKFVSDLFKVEALLFGMAGFLDDSLADDYHKSLKKEFEYLSHKFRLGEDKLHKAQWKFLRLRPANFPTLRMAQMASLLVHVVPLFNSFLEATDLKTVRRLFSINVSDYWLSHYSFKKPSKEGHHRLGGDSIDNIIINSLVPTLVAYANENDSDSYYHSAIQLLEQLPSESNSIIREWNALNLKATSAFDSQGLIEQMNFFCKKRNCLNCAVGTSILKPI